MNTTLVSLAKDFGVPIVVAALPFLPTIYSKLTEPNIHFVFESVNNRNPVHDWNRQLERWIKQLDSPSVKTLDKIPPIWLKQIGAEVQKSLPALLAGAGFKPTENTAVTVLNLTGRELRNIRVHFTGCKGYDSYASWPDSMGSPTNPNVAGPTTTGRMTLRYDRMPAETPFDYSQMQLVFYGDDTSQCSPEVQADTDEGKPAIGQRVILDEYKNQLRQQRRSLDEQIELSFKLFMAVGLLFIYFQVRRLRRNALGAASQEIPSK